MRDCPELVGEAIRAGEDAKHAGHYAAAYVREQYIHEAHTIIYWNESHLARYDEAVRQAEAALAK